MKKLNGEYESTSVPKLNARNKALDFDTLIRSED